MTTKRFLPTLLAAAALTCSLASCNNSSPGGATASVPEDVEVAPLGVLPPAPDTTGGKKAQPAASSLRELNSTNATEDIKKMQEQM